MTCAVACRRVNCAADRAPVVTASGCVTGTGIRRLSPEQIRHQMTTTAAQVHVIGCADMCACRRYVLCTNVGNERTTDMRAMTVRKIINRFQYGRAIYAPQTPYAITRIARGLLLLLCPCARGGVESLYGALTLFRAELSSPTGSTCPGSASPPKRGQKTKPPARRCGVFRWTRIRYGQTGPRRSYTSRTGIQWRVPCLKNPPT